MNLDSLTIDATSPTPLYRQLSYAISQMIQNGDLHPGEALWPERQLSEKLGVARGTVRKAYDECRKNDLITAKQGGNYQVTIDSDGIKQSNDQKAVYLTRKYLDEIGELGYYNNAVLDIIRLNSQIEIAGEKPLRIGTVECRKAMFYVYEEVLNGYDNIQIFPFLIDELLGMPELMGQALECDLILVTPSHYYDLCAAFVDLEPKLLETTLNWSDQTIDEVRSIKEGASVGVLYSNIRTVHVVKSALKIYDIDCNLDVCNISNFLTLEQFLQTKDVLIMEPSFDALNASKFKTSWKSFLNRGGTRIIFRHYVDSSSVQSIHRALTKLLSGREKKLPAVAHSE